MRIAAIRIRDFRSIRDLQLRELGPVSVFYGPNGAGKSAILAAIHAAVRLGALLSGETRQGYAPAEQVIAVGDFRHGADVMRLGLTIQLDPSDLSPALRDLGAHVLEAAMIVERSGEKGSIAKFSTLDLVDDAGERKRDLREYTGSRDSMDMPKDWTERGPSIRRWLQTEIFARLFLPVSALRSVRSHGQHKSSGVKSGSSRQHVHELLRSGAFAQALHAARSSPDVELRDSFEVLRRFLRDHADRPSFDPVYDPIEERYDIQEVVTTPGGGRIGVPLSLRSLGIEQIYVILGTILLGGAAAAGIEEPEAHVHAPTSGKLLRDLLRRMVDDRAVRQLFIATHSNLFDLDPDGWFDVALGDDGTVVARRRDWSKLHEKHLYEPGPARLALLDQLRMIGPDAVVFRRDDGSPVSAEDMIRLLEVDDEVAIDFLRDVHCAAVNVVRLQAARKRSSTAS